MPGPWPILELDVATAPGFVARTRGAIDRNTDRPFVDDCAAITFMDSSAYYAMVNVTRYASAAGYALVVGNVLPAPARVLTFCDWDHDLTIEPAAA
jgi:anti-anti-sigma factor